MIIFFNLFVDTSKKKRELTLLHYEVLAYPKKRNRQVHAMTKHSIDIALKIPFLLKSASFRSEIFGDIAAETVQSPLFSYVTFAKVAKITEITLQIIEILPYYHNKTGF